MRCLSALAVLPAILTVSAKPFPVVQVPFQYTYLLPGGFFSALRDTFLGDTVTPNQTVNALLKEASKTPFVSYSDEFTALLPEKPELELVKSKPGIVFAHEGGVWIPSRNEVWIFSQVAQPPTYITILDLATNKLSRLTTDPPLFNVNGGYYHDGIVYIGSFRDNTTLRATLTAVDPISRKATTLLNSYFGLQYNAIDDTAVAVRGNQRALFFTDLCFVQVTSPYTNLTRCQLPNAVWRYDLNDGTVVPVITQTDIANPNGVRVSRDQRTLYVTDTTATRGSTGALEKPWGSPSVYQYDLNEKLMPVNRQVFSIARQGVADGIHVDDAGRVWTAEYEGVVVRNRKGKVLGVFNSLQYVDLPAQRPIANFAIAGDVLVLFAVDKVYRVKLAKEVVSKGSPIVN